MRHFLVFVSFLVFCAPSVHAASPLAQNLSGKILLQVERNGEAWYVNPETLERHFLYHPDQAYQVMREESVGISNANLARIPMGFYELSGTDTDGDGLVDTTEEAIGTDPSSVDSDGDGYSDRVEVESGHDPLGSGRPATDRLFTDRYLGTIFLQVESHGEAWWVNPSDGKRYYLGRPDDALALMRAFGLGISNANLDQIAVTETKMDCGEDFDCLLAATEVGQSAFIHRSGSLDFLGLLITSESLLESALQGTTFQTRDQIVKTTIMVTEEQRQNLLDSGKTEQEITDLEAEAMQNAEIGEGALALCTFARLDLLLTHLRQVYAGNHSSESSEDGITTLFNVDDQSVLGTCTSSVPEETSEIPVELYGF